jgi:hypothetical protein
VLFDVGRKFVGYEDADSTIDPDVRRKQKEWSGNVTVVAPVKDNLAIIATVGARDVDASLSNYTYDDQYITIGLSWSF